MMVIFQESYLPWLLQLQHHSNKNTSTMDKRVLLNMHEFSLENLNPSFNILLNWHVYYLYCIIVFFDVYKVYN